MANLNEISIKARSKAHDFIWFSSKPNSFLWFNKYKSFFNDSEHLLNCTVEIDSDNYKLYFGKIYSQKHDHINRRTYYTLQVENGKRGSISSQYMYKFICAYLSETKSFLQSSISKYHEYCKSNDKKSNDERDFIQEKISKSNISTLLDDQFPDEYLSSIFPVKPPLSIEVEAEIQDKLKKVIDELPFEDTSFSNEDKSNEILVFDSMKARLNLFLSELKKITNNEPVSKKIALILTNGSLKSEDLCSFDQNEYSKVVCLTTNDAESETLPLSKKKQTEKPKETPTIPSIKEIKNVLDKLDEKKNPEQQCPLPTQGKNLEKKNILFIILYIILFVTFLIIVVRSCCPTTSDIQTENHQTEQSRSK